MSNRIAGYVRGVLGGDITAGVTVAVFAIPQSMAYALIAGVPPQYGLYAAVFPVIVAALVGSSNRMVTGPTNAISVATLSVIAGLVGIEGILAADRMPVVFLILCFWPVCSNWATC